MFCVGLHFCHLFFFFLYFTCRRINVAVQSCSILKVTHVVLCPLWVLLSEPVSFHSGSGVSFCLDITTSLTALAGFFRGGFCFCLSFLFTSVSESLAPSLLSDGLWFALLNTLPSPPLPSPVNKQPEPAPRRTSVLNRKQSPLTSPTFQPPLPPLEAGTPTQLEPHPPPPPSEAEQPGLSVAGSGGGGGGLVGGVQVATVQHQVVTQLSTEESR